jgi:PTS system nitrogen regulatory IIA component
MGTYVQLTVQDVAKFLKVSDKMVYKWIERNEIPVHRVDGTYRFNRSEILEWAHSRNRQVSTAIYRIEDIGRPLPTVAEAIEAGGILYGLAGSDKASVLKAMIGGLPLPGNFDRETLLQLVMARERLGSTAVGKGIAIPHVRKPIILGVSAPRITLCFLEHPIEFEAPDGLPVHTLFWMVSSTVRAHTHMLARLATLVRDPGFQSVLERRAPRDEILGEARRIEAGLGSRPEAGA